jgi:hypothetical protein
VTLVWTGFTGNSVRVRYVASELPFEPVKVTNAEVFLIPLGCETTNSKATFVFADIKSRSFGVKEKDSTIGGTFAYATKFVEVKIKTNRLTKNLLTIIDLILSFKIEFFTNACAILATILG